MWSPDFAHSSELLMHSPQDSKELVQHSNRAAEPILQQTFVLPGPQCNSPVGRSGGYHCPQITIPTLLGTELSWTNLPSIPQQPVPSHSSLCVMYSRLQAKVLPKRYQKRGRTSGRFGARNPNSLWLQNLFVFSMMSRETFSVAFVSHEFTQKAFLWFYTAISTPRALYIACFTSRWVFRHQVPA